MIPRPRAQGKISAQVNRGRKRGQSGCSRPVPQRGAHRPRRREESSARLCVDVDGRARRDSAFRKPRSRSGSSGLEAAAASSPSAPPFPQPSCASPRADEGKAPHTADRSTRSWSGSGRVKQQRRRRHNKREPDRGGERERGGLVTWEDAPLYLHAPEARALAPFRPRTLNL